MKESWVDISYNRKLFQKLKEGDTIKIAIGDNNYITSCKDDAYYNSDCDEPGWEVETGTGTISFDNEIFVSAETYKALTKR